MRLAFKILLMVMPLLTGAQTEAPKGFSENQFIFLVDMYHPIASQGNLLVKQGKAKVTEKRGAFDPVLKGDLGQKYYDGKKYYSLLNTGLEIPTWYGVDFNLGFSQNEGQFLNDQNFLPQDGLAQAGIKIPVVKGLLFDKRRRDVKQAKVFYQSSINQRRLIVNDLRFDALRSYWEWVSLSNQLKVAKESITLVEQRIEGVRGRFEFGDASGIDTLEAFIQLQNRRVMLNKIQLKLRDKELKMSNFLWYENGVPVKVTDSLKAPLIRELEDLNVGLDEIIERQLNWSVDSNPSVIEYVYKRESLEFERRYKIEQLKPQVDLKYNFLNEPLNITDGPVFNENDYNWGVKAKFPLFLRQARGGLKLTKLKIQDVDLTIQQKRREVDNKMQFFRAQNDQLRLQLDQLKQMVINYELLLEGEKLKFNNGESSLFLINSREIKLIEARLKYIDLFCQHQIGQRGLFWARGDLAKVTL